MISQGDFSVVSFSLDHIDPVRRKSAWTDALGEYLYDHDADFPIDFMHASFKGVSFGSLRAATIACDPMHAVRTARHIASNGIDSYLVLLPRRGAVKFMQRNSETIVSAGQFALISASEPYSSYQHESAISDALLIPGTLLRHHQPDIDDWLCRKFAITGMQRMFIDYASSLCQNAAELSASGLHIATDIMLKTFTDFLGSGDGMPKKPRPRFAH